MPRGVGPTTRPAMIPRSDIILRHHLAGLQHGSRVEHETEPLQQYTFICSSYFVVGLCVSTVSGPLRVSSHATVTGHHGQVTFQWKWLSQDDSMSYQVRQRQMKLQSSTTFLSLSLEQVFLIRTEEFSIHESRVGH